MFLPVTLTVRQARAPSEELQRGLVEGGTVASCASCRMASASSSSKPLTVSCFILSISLTHLVSHFR